MTLAAGARIGKYELVALLGAGGMGQVWKARDVVLGRDVAVKTQLSPDSQDPVLVQRLEREARVLASLSHPNIAAIHGLSEAEGLVLVETELVGGQTLAERLEGGPLSVRTALEIALQIAEALEAAHAKGVVHRDLKPANIMLMAGDRVKVLDFGLAKILTRGAADAARPSPVKMASITREGNVLGTLAYMSPEQASGEEANEQTDIWSFGCVLFELLSGCSPFAKNTPAETLGDIFSREPEYAALRRDTPDIARRLVRRCLQKEPHRRLHHIADARLDIAEALSGPTSAMPDARGPRTAGGRSRWLVPIATFALGAVTAAVGSLVVDGERAVGVSPRVGRYAVGAPVPVALTVSGDRMVAISSDDKHVAFTSGGTVSIQTMGLRDRTILGSGNNAFFSMDGAWIAYFTQDNILMKASVSERVPIPVAQAESARVLGGTWRGDTIVFATQAGVFSVSANGTNERPRLLLEAPEEANYGWPEFLPNGQAVLLTRLGGNATDYASIVLLELESATSSQKLVDLGVQRALSARYVPRPDGGGHIVYATEGGRLVAREFDAESYAIGQGRSATADIQVHVNGTYMAAGFDVSDKGTIVFVESPPFDSQEVVLIDRSGKLEVLDLGGAVGYPRYSADGNLIAFERGSATPNRRIWIFDTRTGIADQLSDSGAVGRIYEDIHPVWSRDGRRVYFATTRNGFFQVAYRDIGASGGDRILLDEPEILPLAALSDGRLIVMRGPYPTADIGILDPAAPEVMQWLTSTEYSEVTPSVSSDDSLLAFASNRAGGRYEIYVKSLVDEGREIRVSQYGGFAPTFASDDSGELFFFGFDDTGVPGMMMATIARTPALAVAVAPQLLIRNGTYGLYARGGGLRTYDISPQDGRILIPQIRAGTEPYRTTIWFSEDWLAE